MRNSIKVGDTVKLKKDYNGERCLDFMDLEMKVVAVFKYDGEQAATFTEDEEGMGTCFTRALEVVV